MKAFPLSSPPENPGIYILANLKTGQLYIGRSVNLRRRWAEWKGVFSTGLGNKNRNLIEILRAGGLEAWTFGVFRDMPGATDAQLALYEQKAISRMVATKPDLVLNALLPTETVSATGLPASEALSVILDESGVAMSQRAAAARLKVTKQAVKKRLAAWRDRGVYSVKITDWAALHAPSC